MSDLARATYGVGLQWHRDVRRRRQLNREAGPLRFAFAFRDDLPTVRKRKLLDDRETQADAPVLARARSIRLAKRLEDMRQEIGPNSLSVVPDASEDLPIQPR